MQNHSSVSILGKLDRTGLICSGACAAHCLIVPVIAYTSGTISNFLASEWIHIAFLLILIILVPIAFSRSRKIHKKNLPLLLGFFGLTLLICSVLIEIIHLHIPYLDKIMTLSGSLILAMGHFLNIKHIKKAN
ncbi:MAG: MerC family mercury resistance protein [Bacteriovoracaceae bacterium]|jgi:hypothetical protein|nr:MerC family mercury resistance protein [Bacteriovoracaceae bacterium]